MRNKSNANWHRGRHVYLFHSQKNDSSIKVESFLEYCYACIFECDSSITRFASQPETMHSFYDGKVRMYTPDFLVEYEDGRAEFIEVHPTPFLTDIYLRRIEHFSGYSQKESQIAIRIVTEENLCAMSRVNYQLIADSMSSNPCLKDHLGLPEQITFGELIVFLTTSFPNAIAESYSLIAMGYYTFDSQNLLQLNTPLSRGAVC